jgi:hypothetical protein
VSNLDYNTKDNAIKIDDFSASNTKESSKNTFHQYTGYENQSKMARRFSYSDSFTNTDSAVTFANYQDWQTHTSLHFSNLRTDIFANGDAEESDIFWDEYYPESFEDDLIRTNSSGEHPVLGGDHSWLNNITGNHSYAIAGISDLDEELVGESVIFSLKYSLYENTLDPGQYSYICLRLYFQFDIEIYIWFDGNPGALTNVTGPGGFAALFLTNSFDQGIHSYSLNVTDLGLQLFNQKPDKLRNFAIETYAHEPYHIEYLLDDISLTDKVFPSDVNLKVNSELVTDDSIGHGNIQLFFDHENSFSFNIQSTTSYQLYWNCNYDVFAQEQFYINRAPSLGPTNQILWSEETNLSCYFPEEIDNFWLEKWIPKNSSIISILYNDEPNAFEQFDQNNTWKALRITIPPNNGNLAIQLCLDNLIQDLDIIDQVLSHDDSLEFEITSNIPNSELSFLITTNQEEFLSERFNTDSQGKAVFFGDIFTNTMQQGNYSLIVFWFSNYSGGIIESSFQLISKPALLQSATENIIVNYQESINLIINYINLETDETIDDATIAIFSPFCNTTLFQETSDGLYRETINTITLPGNYSILANASKEGYATHSIIIQVTILPSTTTCIITTPLSVIPGEMIPITIEVTNNDSIPIRNATSIIYINEEQIAQKITNNSGFVSTAYFLTKSYAYHNLNVSCEILIGEEINIKRAQTIDVQLFEIERTVELGPPTQSVQNLQYNEVIFSFEIIYPSIGEKWRAKIPSNYNPKTAYFSNGNDNISLVVTSSNTIIWDRKIQTLEDINDFLLLVIPTPEPYYNFKITKRELKINITLETSKIPFKNLSISIPKDKEWNNFEDWQLLHNGNLITESNKFQNNDDNLTFFYDFSINDNLVSFQLMGTRRSLISFSPSVILFGVGLLILTIISTILVIKKRSHVSLDIQI